MYTRFTNLSYYLTAKRQLYRQNKKCAFAWLFANTQKLCKYNTKRKNHKAFNKKGTVFLIIFLLRREFFLKTGTILSTNLQNTDTFFKTHTKAHVYHFVSNTRDLISNLSNQRLILPIHPTSMKIQSRSIPEPEMRTFFIKKSSKRATTCNYLNNFVGKERQDTAWHMPTMP